jgi:hypothetical protein
VSKKVSQVSNKERSALTSPGINAGVSGRIFDDMVQKKEIDSCSHGQWMVKYRSYSFMKGKLTPKKNTQIYCRTKDGILVDRMRFNMLSGRI